MKTVFALAAFSAIFQGAIGCVGHGIIPEYHFVNISNSPHVDEETRAWARSALSSTQDFLRGHISGSNASAGEGIVDSGDDSTFENEQDAQDSADLQMEMAALNRSSTNDTPQPGAEEDVKRRRSQGPAKQMAKRQGGRFRAVWTDNMLCRTRPPATLVREEYSAPAADADINRLFDGIGNVDNLFRQLYGRNSINNAGLRYYGTAHYCVRYMNAVWDGAQLVIGDGDGRVFASNSFIRSLDVIGHEVTHGIIQYANPLYYYGQSGALNEHLADVFGVLTTQYTRQQSTSQATWLIGEGIPVGGAALRSMKAPGTAYNTPALGQDPQRATFSQYYAGPQDNQGVHINSGIPNRAFYLFAVSQGGFAFNVPGRIWYNVLNGGQGRFRYRDETFQTFAQKTVNAASQLYGTAVASQLAAAWRQVGLL